MDYYLGQIMLFAGPKVPSNWLPCEGQELSVSQYAALYSLIGNTYGGNGNSTFALPDLRGRVPLSQGQGPGLSPRPLGQSGGESKVAVDLAAFPLHSHGAAASTQAATTAKPDAAVILAATPAETTFYYAPDTGQPPPNPVTMAVATVQPAGSGNPHDNVMPSLGIRYLICVNGIYPLQKY